MSDVNEMRAVSPSKVIELNIRPDLTLSFPLKHAYCLMLFATGISWSETGLTQFNGELAVPYVFSSENNAWPDQTVNRFTVIGNGITDADGHDAPFESLWFVLGPHVDQSIEVDRLDVLHALNAYFVEHYGPEFQLQDFYETPVEEGDSKYIPSGVEGVLLSTGSYVGFRKKINHDVRAIVDVELFTSNQNLKRPGHVDKLTFTSNVYLGGYNGKEARAAIQYTFGRTDDVMVDC
jgi:hypothetical protein